MIPLRRAGRGRGGMVLLEVIVSIALLGGIGIASVAALSQAVTSVRQAQANERAFMEAVALLDAATLWSREDLDRRLGYRRQGIWMLHIARTDVRFYRLTVFDSTAGRRIVETVVLRAEGDR